MFETAATPIPSSAMNQRDNRRSKRVLFSLLVLGALTTAISLGTFADFNASTSYTNQTFSTAKVELNANNPSDTTSLNLTLGRMLPGDTMTKALDVSNTGDTDVLSYQLSTVATTSSALDQGSPSPLRVWIARCSVAWVTGACSGTQSDLVGTSAAPTSLIFSNAALASVFCKTSYAERGVRGIGACTLSDVDHLQIRVNLNSSGAAGAGADNALQGLSSTVKFDFSGRQPTAHNF